MQDLFSATARTSSDEFQTLESKSLRTSLSSSSQTRERRQVVHKDHLLPNRGCLDESLVRSTNECVQRVMERLSKRHPSALSSAIVSLSWTAFASSPPVLIADHGNILAITKNRAVQAATVELARRICPARSPSKVNAHKTYGRQDIRTIRTGSQETSLVPRTAVWMSGSDGSDVSDSRVECEVAKSKIRLDWFQGRTRRLRSEYTISESAHPLYGGNIAFLA